MRRFRIFKFLSLAFLSSCFIPLSFVQAQGLDVEIIERADADFDTCSLGQVTGLKVNGDGFLAVRSGPSSKFQKIDELYNGNKVWLFEERKGWYGVVYGVDELSCSPIKKSRPLRKKGKKGWIYGKFVKVIAG